MAMTFDTVWGSYPDGAVAEMVLDAREVVGAGAEEGARHLGPPDDLPPPGDMPPAPDDAAKPDGKAAAAVEAPPSALLPRPGIRRRYVLLMGTRPRPERKRDGEE